MGVGGCMAHHTPTGAAGPQEGSCPPAHTAARPRTAVTRGEVGAPSEGLLVLLPHSGEHAHAVGQEEQNGDQQVPEQQLDEWEVQQRVSGRAGGAHTACTCGQAAPRHPQTQTCTIHPPTTPTRSVGQLSAGQHQAHQRGSLPIPPTQPTLSHQPTPSHTHQGASASCVPGCTRPRCTSGPSPPHVYSRMQAARKPGNGREFMGGWVHGWVDGRVVVWRMGGACKDAGMPETAGSLLATHSRPKHPRPTPRSCPATPAPGLQYAYAPTATASW